MLFLSHRLSLLSPRNPILFPATLVKTLPRSIHPPPRSSMAPPPPPPPPELVAEYAKSGRSSCKGCGSSIAAGVLRLGLSSKDPRGFDSVKWHHLGCFPSNSASVGTAEEIKGFSSLKECDQVALKKLEADGLLQAQSDKEISGPGKEKGLGIDFSAPDIKDKYKIIAEYAKSGRSSCKGCGEVIVVGSMRLGLSSKDPRGFDFVKWLHLDCFPLQALLISAAEDIVGFSSLKNCDQEALQKLDLATPACQSDQKAHKRNDNIEIENSDLRSAKIAKVDNGDVEGGESDGKNSEKPKLSGSSKESGVLMDFSISDIKDKYKDASLPSNWKAFKTIIFREREDGLRDSEKIAAFDFDGCLANTSVKRIGPDAWTLMHPLIPEKLQGLYNDGYKLVIFTNESNIARWKNKRQQAVDSKLGRLDNFINHVKVPIQVFIACGLGKNKDQTDDPFRKPKPGMWRIMEAHFNSGMAIDMNKSFYVGDAAGRVNDHSDADIKFAQAIGLKFFVPEEYFVA